LQERAIAVSGRLALSQQEYAADKAVSDGAFSAGATVDGTAFAAVVTPVAVGVGTWYEASTGRHQLPRGLARRCTSTLSAVNGAPRSSYNSGMRNYLREKAPWWLLVLINGGTFWIVTLVGHALAPSWWPAGYVWSGLTAACFGLVMATLTVKSRQPRSEKDTTDS
jgi:hypothetical protein